tara:strand:+ start:248 stop:349 length:102 start_codon:yes stop_codon:yes gene_type:complete
LLLPVAEPVVVGQGEIMVAAVLVLAVCLQVLIQ